MSESVLLVSVLRSKFDVLVLFGEILVLVFMIFFFMVVPNEIFNRSTEFAGLERRLSLELTMVRENRKMKLEYCVRKKKNGDATKKKQGGQAWFTFGSLFTEPEVSYIYRFLCFFDFFVFLRFFDFFLYFSFFFVYFSNSIIISLHQLFISPAHM